MWGEETQEAHRHEAGRDGQECGRDRGTRAIWGQRVRDEVGRNGQECGRQGTHKGDVAKK